MSDTLTGMMSAEDFLAHQIAISSDMTEDEFLEHYGKKGMKWGKRAAAIGGTVGGAVKSKAKAVQLNGQRNRASRANDKQARNDSIDSSRARVKNGATKASIKDAKISYKSAKKEIGSREAKKALTAVKASAVNDRANADKMKSGRESVVYALTGYKPKASGSGSGFDVNLDSRKFA